MGWNQELWRAQVGERNQCTMDAILIISSAVGQRDFGEWGQKTATSWTDIRPPIGRAGDGDPPPPSGNALDKYDMFSGK